MKGVPPTGSLTTDIEGGSAIRNHVITSEGQGKGHCGMIESVRSKRGLHAKRFMDVPQSTVFGPEGFAEGTECQRPLGEDVVLAALMAEGDADNEENSADEEEEIKLSIIPSPQKAPTLPRPGSPEPTKAGRPAKHRTKTSPVARKVSHGTGENLPGMKTPRGSGPQIAARHRPINFRLRKRLRFATSPDSSSLMDDRKEPEQGLKTRDLINQDIAMATGGGNDMLGKLVLARISVLEEGMTEIKDILKKVKNLSGKSK